MEYTDWECSADSAEYREIASTASVEGGKIDLEAY